MKRDRTLFWFFIVLQAVGCQIILWTALPVYHRLLAGGQGRATNTELALAMFAVVLMQFGHWTSMWLRPRLRFRRNAVLGHVLFSLGELSLIFASTLAALVFFDRFADLEFHFGRFLVLAAILFSVCSYKYQVGKLGEQLIEGEAGEHQTARDRRPAA